eukprot:3908825-Prymnesium_polylepis.1
MAMCERDVAACRPLLSPAAEPVGRQTPIVSLNMPSRRLKGTSRCRPLARTFLVKTESPPRSLLNSILFMNSA